MKRTFAEISHMLCPRISTPLEGRALMLRSACSEMGANEEEVLSAWKADRVHKVLAESVTGAVARGVPIEDLPVTDPHQFLPTEDRPSESFDTLRGRVSVMYLNGTICISKPLGNKEVTEESPEVRRELEKTGLSFDEYLAARDSNIGTRKLQQAVLSALALGATLESLPVDLPKLFSDTEMAIALNERHPWKSSVLEPTPRGNICVESTNAGKQITLSRANIGGKNMREVVKERLQLERIGIITPEPLQIAGEKSHAVSSRNEVLASKIVRE